MMDRFWIKKLREVKVGLKQYLAAKARFESRSGRSSLADLREGQRLKREEEKLRDHLAQLAEFGTGIPARKFDFRLDLKGPYLVTTEGEHKFGPTALLDIFPFINFDVDKIFGKQEEQKPEPDEKAKPIPKPDKIEKFTARVTQKYEAPIFNAIERRKFTSIKPVKFEQKLEIFTARLAAADKYVNSILDKYIPGPAEIAKPPGFYIYQGQFVYLSRRGKWARVSTTVLSQKDYFAEAETSMPILARKRIVPRLEGDLEISEAADLITDDLAEPVAAPDVDLGLGYFVPVRRLGQTKPPVVPTGLPLVGSREFAYRVSQKAEDSGHPVEQISPAYVSMTGRKIDRARSFAEKLKRKLQLPKTEPARLAVEALLPAMREIVAAGERLEEPVLKLEKDFDDLVSMHLRPFRLAAEPVGVSRAWMGSGETRVERVLRAPQADALGVIDKYMPDITDPRQAMITLVTTRTYPTEVFRQVEQVPPRMAPEMQAAAMPLRDRAPIARPSETAERGLPGLFGRLRSLLPESLRRPARLLPGALSSLTERFSADRLGGLAGGVIGRLSRGLPGRIAERFGGLLPLSNIERGAGGLLGRIGGSTVGALLQTVTSGLAGDRAGGLFGGLRRAVSGLTGGAEPTGLIGRAAGLLRGGLGDLRPGRLGGMLDRLTAGGGGLPGLTSGGAGGMLSGVLSRIPSLARSVTDRIPGGLSGAISRVLPVAQSAVSGLTERVGGLIPSGISQAVSGLLPSTPSGIGSALGRAGQMLGGLAGRLPGIGSLAERASGMASGLLRRAGMPSLGGIAERAGGLVRGFTGGGESGGLGSLISRATSALGGAGGILSRGRSLISGAAQMLPGAAGRAAQRVTGMLGGGMGAARSAVSSAMGGMGGIGALAGRAEGLSSAISGLTSRGGGALGDLGSRISGATESLGAALPSMGGVRGMAEGAAESVTSRLPSIGALPGIGSALSGVTRRPELTQALDTGNLPRGWDRPPFEVGSAITRQISERVSGQTGALPRAGRQALADYGLSVIDLEEQAAETVSDTRQQIEEAAEIELDDSTIDEVYFRLRRILETESERMGGEA